jgi:hypothetical protein
MSSRSSVAQEEFLLFRLDAVQDADFRPLDHSFTAVACAGNGDLLKSENKCEAESFCPADFISDEVNELIRNWELSHSRQQDNAHAVESMESKSFSASSESVYEPLRCMLGAAAPPPKRFHRTFWRSLTVRVVRLEKQNAYDKAVMSSN